MNRTRVAVFSLSSSGGEGWGEEDVFSSGSWKAFFRFGARIGTMNVARAASPSPPLEERAGERRLFHVFCALPNDVGEATHRISPSP
jgi:hypothetical protein